MDGRFHQAIWQKFAGALASLAIWLGCVSSPVACPLPLSPKPDLPERGISAHRGGLLGCPVNTIGAFHRAICQGVQQIELDVRATADDVIVVSHDDQITGKNQTLHISESTSDQIQKLELPSCTGENEKNEHIPMLQEALAIMPHNIWINVDIKKHDPRVGKLVAQTVAQAHRFDQVIFGVRKNAAPAIRQVAKENISRSWIANMNRKFFRGQYVDATIDSCFEFIQLLKVPYLPFIRGKPSQDTMTRLKATGVRVNYSWLKEDNERELREELQDLFEREVDFVLVDHVGPAMKAASSLGIPPIVPHWDRASIPPDAKVLNCQTTQ